MKSFLLLASTAIGCVAFSSCVVVPDRPNGPQKPRPNSELNSLTSQDQQKIQKQRDRMKAAEKRKKETVVERTTEREPTTTTDKPAEKRSDYPYANPVPGKEGFVFSPFNNKLVDVREIPSSTLVQDPTYPASEKKYFRVP